MPTWDEAGQACHGADQARHGGHQDCRGALKLEAPHCKLDLERRKLEMTRLELATADAEFFSGGPSLARDAESIHRARRRKGLPSPRPFWGCGEDIAAGAVPPQARFKLASSSVFFAGTRLEGRGSLRALLAQADFVQVEGAEIRSEMISLHVEPGIDVVWQIWLVTSGSAYPTDVQPPMEVRIMPQIQVCRRLPPKVRHGYVADRSVMSI